MTKYLSILRHAKSDHSAQVDGDHERPLNKRGRRSCKLIADYLTQHGTIPDLILASDATRTQQTSNELIKFLGQEIKTIFDPVLYLSTPKEMMTQLCAQESHHQHIMLIAHNPGCHQLATELTGTAEPTNESAVALFQQFPTTACAHFSVTAPNWHSTTPSHCQLLSFIYPKML